MREVQIDRLEVVNPTPRSEMNPLDSDTLTTLLFGLWANPLSYPLAGWLANRWRATQGDSPVRQRTG